MRECSNCGELTDYNHASYCKECFRLYRMEKREVSMKRKEHQGGYTHVLRNRYSGDLCKWDLRMGSMPDGYVVVFVARPGEVLPRGYWALEVYGEK